MKLIDKDAVLAKIDKRIKVLQKHLMENHKTICHLDSVMQSVNSLEVKEVDLEKEIEEEWKKWIKNGDVGYIEVAKHFFNLGLRASNPLEADLETVQRIKECPFREVICNRYEDNPIECKGQCSWVVDHLKLKQLKAQKGE